jgi:hypothetical protein
VHVERPFFNQDSELAREEKFEKIRNWSTQLNVPDYTLPDLFGLGKLK